jgi:hypothetical protein
MLSAAARKLEEARDAAEEKADRAWLTVHLRGYLVACDTLRLGPPHPSARSAAQVIFCSTDRQKRLLAEIFGELHPDGGKGSPAAQAQQPDGLL